jgi:hypothetical protein
MNATREAALNKLINYAKVKFDKEDCRNGEELIIKPCGAFKEHHNFYAKMEKRREINGSYYYILTVQVDDIFEDSDSCMHVKIFREVRQCQCVDETLRHFVGILDNLEFDIKTGKMVHKSSVISSFDMNQVIFDLWNIDVDLNCCVCGERTDTKTKCGHRLCIPCWASNNTTFYLDSNDDDDDNPKCPMCRRNVYSVGP